MAQYTNYFMVIYCNACYILYSYYINAKYRRRTRKRPNAKGQVQLGPVSEMNMK